MMLSSNISPLELPVLGVKLDLMTIDSLSLSLESPSTAVVRNTHVLRPISVKYENLAIFYFENCTVEKA
jgi:hypothetical protein